MNMQKVTVGIVSIFFAFFVPVLNHGFWAVAGTIQNAGRMMGDNDAMLEHIWAKEDLLNFINQMPWVMWLYFLFMLGMGLYLIVNGWKDKPEDKIEHLT